MIDTIKKYSRSINRILLFVAAIALVVYIFPRQGKFQFEYAKGKPWKHATLIAPFDFPIYKTPAELKVERENALKNFKPYFTFQANQQDTILDEFETEYHSNRDRLLSNYKFLTDPLPGNADYNLFSGIRFHTKKIITGLYEKGVISLPEGYQDKPSSMVIMVIKDNFAEPYELGEFYTYQEAYRHLSTELTKYIKNRTSVNSADIDRFISDMQLNRYLESNLVFETARSEQEKEVLLQNISLTSGIVVSGQRIIDTGELITEETGKILDSLKMEYEARLGKGVSQYFILLGQGFIVALMFIIIFFFLFFFRKDVYNKLSSVLFLLLMVVSMITLAQVAYRADTFPIYIIPFAILPIIIRIFFDSRLAFFLHVTTILMAAFFARNSFEFVIMQIPAGLTSMFSLYRMVRRSQLIRAALLIILTYSLFYAALSLWQEGDISRIDHNMFLQFIINGGLLLLVYPLIYIFEKLFGFLSDVTLVELSDTNHPVLRRLAEKAPGTFQHSIQVGNLAQEAVYKIGGNPLLVRAGAMYHDIGKLGSPIFFTENQNNGLNPHEKMPYDESAQIVIHHIESGIKMAQKEKLPRQIIDFIATHQGTMQTKYFYNSFINQNPDEDVDISMFSYPGPTPFTKETAVLMMADSVEAASRSLKSYTDDEIDKLVENIINSQIAEDQFIEAPITFKEISQVKDIFKQKLKNIYHARIEYPELKKKKL
jgi:cyclic-di-AMP phosphodiesterase PgpH